MDEQTAMDYHEGRLAEIQEAYKRADELKAHKKARQKYWDEQVGEARAERTRLIESPVPGTTDERKRLLQQIQEWQQRVDEARAGKKTEMADIRVDLKDAQERLKVLIEDDGQIDWTGQPAE